MTLQERAAAAREDQRRWKAEEDQRAREQAISRTTLLLKQKLHHLGIDASFSIDPESGTPVAECDGLRFVICEHHYEGALHPDRYLALLIPCLQCGQTRAPYRIGELHEIAIALDPETHGGDGPYCPPCARLDRHRNYSGREQSPGERFLEMMREYIQEVACDG